ncbi:MAG: 30S ribosomal protein S16 [Dehalococcoidia bacterium]|nr:MAG: 30S ribosomal protein S16 [bacterium]MCE7928068.1 30S ribosomal protein S16 [Chloroflexi bacterium CFX7]MCK6564590.1 30S ribosomal protein S16 [Dehalococcoidia bacterium]MCL4229975.1 30S ribosomal protein S16 [Dehalococcoidia bacterium]NUQ56486.1 30S ribosomal protein S16 [Dehalococcoidia bacterium]
MIRIRLRRVGKKRQPYYRLVVAQKEAKRDGAFLETLGSYDPHANPPSIQLDEAKTREWLTKGAQPSEAAEKILRRAGIVAGAAAAPAKDA